MGGMVAIPSHGWFLTVLTTLLCVMAGLYITHFNGFTVEELPFRG